MMNSLYKFILVTVMILLMQTSHTLASEVSGTISAGYDNQSNVTAGAYNNNPVFFTVVDNNKGWEVPTTVKALLTGGLILEIIVLIGMHFARKRRRAYP